MRLLPVILLILTSGHISLAAQQSPSTPASGSPTVSAPALPKAVGGFRLSETSIFDDAMLGTHYSYGLGRNLYATVAVQPSLTLERTAATADYIISRSAQSFRTLPRTTPGGIPSFEIVRDTPDTLVIGSRTVPGHIVAAKVRRGSAERYEAWYIYFLGSRYVRVMAQSLGTSAAAPDSEVVRHQIEEFVRSVVPTVASTWRL